MKYYKILHNYYNNNNNMIKSGYQHKQGKFCINLNNLTNNFNAESIAIT